LFKVLINFGNRALKGLIKAKLTSHGLFEGTNMNVDVSRGTAWPCLHFQKRYADPGTSNCHNKTPRSIKNTTNEIAELI